MLLAFILLTLIPALISTVEARESEVSPDHGVPIGIDLGTTYMSVAVFMNDRIEIIPNDQGMPVTPSYVAFTPEGERLIGDAAKAQITSNPQNTVFDVKRLIGRTWNDSAVQKEIKYLPYRVVNRYGEIRVQVDIGGKSQEFTPEEISAMLLTYMKQIAEMYLGQKVTSAVITIPAYFNNAQRQATKDAGKIAGLNILRVMNEPTAAVLGYDINRNSKDGPKNILVYDLGGGTVDVSIVNSGYGAIEVLSTRGNTHLGGEDFDRCIVEYLIKIIKEKTGHDIHKTSRGLQKLRREAERAKRTLSSKHVANIKVERVVSGFDLSETLTRAKFEELNKDLFEATLVPIQKALDACGLEKQRDIDEILFVGGSTYIPKIRQLVQDYLWWQTTPIRDVNPVEAVAYGAAVQASMLKQEEVPYDRIVLDIVPISLGLEQSGGVMSILIGHGTGIPTTKKKVYTTAKDNQVSVEIKIFEGESKFTKHNNLLGTFDLTGIYPAPAGIPKIEVSFEVGIYGILTVSAAYSDAGLKESLTIITDNSRLSSSEIKKKAGEIKQFADRDITLRKQLEVKDEFERYIYDMMNRVNEIGSELRDTDRNYVGKALKDELAWLERYKAITSSDIEHRKRILGAIVQARIGNLNMSPAKDKGNHSHQEL